MRPNPWFPADLVTFTEEILNGKLHFLCSERQIRAGDISKWRSKIILEMELSNTRGSLQQFNF